MLAGLPVLAASAWYTTDAVEDGSDAGLLGTKAPQPYPTSKNLNFSAYGPARLCVENDWQLKRLQSSYGIFFCCLWRDSSFKALKSSVQIKNSLS